MKDFDSAYEDDLEDGGDYDEHDEAHDERIPPRDINGEEKVDQYTIDIGVAHYHDLHYRAIERAG